MMGFLGLLCLLFIGLKLTNHVTWPWWKVLAPLWVPLAFITAAALIMTLAGIVYG